jgi:hypothetical protein
VTVVTLHLLLAAGQEVEQEAQGGSRTGRCAVGPVDVVGQQEGVDLIGLEVAAGERGQAPGEEPDQRGELVPADSPEAERHPEGLADPGQAPSVDVGGRLQEVRLEISSETLQFGVDAQERLGVVCRDPPDLLGGPLGLRPPRQDVAVLERDLEAGPAGNHPETVIVEAKVADNLGAEHAGDVRGGGGSDPGRDLLGDAGPSDDVATFQDQRPEARSGQVGSRGEAVVAGADHHGVVPRSLTLGHNSCLFRPRYDTTVHVAPHLPGDGVS